jgi:hypothetical protein
VLGAEETDTHICLRAFVYKDGTIDLIVGLHSNNISYNASTILFLSIFSISKMGL